MVTALIQRMLVGENIMITRKDAIAFCIQFNNAYEDYPFHDRNWTVMRHVDNRKAFAWIFEKDEYIWINVKCDPEWRDFWRNAFDSVIPGWHLNKEHWNSIILDGSIPDVEIERMIAESFDLTKTKLKKRK